MNQEPNTEHGQTTDRQKQAHTSNADQAQAWDIQMQALTGGYDGRKILDQLTATLPGGKISAILGESGCGKTTLLRIILGLLPPMGGRLLLGGRDIFSFSPRRFHKVRRRFGVLFQDGALLGSLSLLENVALPLTEHTKLPRAMLHESAQRTLELVGLGAFSEYYPSEISGGMRKRAGLARAIITEPPVLFCDEPTSGLDPITAAQMDQLLLDMKTEYPQMTIVVITHDLGSVAHIADHVLLMRGGGALFSGTYSDLLQSTEPYIRQFLDRKAEEERRMVAPPLQAPVREALATWLDD